MNFGLRRRGFRPEPPVFDLVFVDGPSPIVTTDRGESRSYKHRCRNEFRLTEGGALAPNLRLRSREGRGGSRSCKRMLKRISAYSACHA